MKTIGIICEYNPLHLGHIGHIEKSKKIISGKTEDVRVVAVMSGNFVQRGDFAVFNKQSRAKTAISCGADLVIEIPTPYVLQSAEGYAAAGVSLLDNLGVCDYLSFGSESGDINLLSAAAATIITPAADQITKEWLEKGISFASARQKAADYLLGENAYVFHSPNNVLGIEYLKALNKQKSAMLPITIKRTGGNHDGNTGYSASALRKSFINGSVPKEQMHEAATAVYTEEIKHGRGPVSIKNAQQAILSRLRMQNDYSQLSGTSEGLEKRLEKYANSETSLESILEKTKSKRYTMSRLRRMLLCLALNIKKEDIVNPPPYIRVLAMNEKGKTILAKAKKKATLPILTKPASVYKFDVAAIKLFEHEAAATNFYVIAYQNEAERTGNREWQTSPIII